MTGDDEPCMSGALACGLRDVALEIAGAPAIARALGRVPPEPKRSYEDLLPVGWVPIATMEAVFSQIALELCTSVPELHVQVARRSVERTMRTLWRVLLRVTTDAALVSRTPAMFARSYNRGRLEARITRPGRAEIELLDWSDVPDWPLRATRIGVETVLTIAGRRPLDVLCTRTHTGALFVASWR